MSDLLDEISRISKDAASELRSAGFTTDSDIRSLDRQDLLELLPGKDKLRERKKIHKLICGTLQSPKSETLLKDLKDFVHSEEDVLTDRETILQGLHKCKRFTESLIELLETKRENPEENIYHANSERHAPVPEASATHPTRRSWFSNWPIWSAQEWQGTKPLPTVATVWYNMVVSGKTLDKHVDVLKRLNGPFSDGSGSLQLKEAEHKKSQVTIVFCPVVSRAGTDVDAALQKISSDKPVIVVVMYHMHSPAAYPAPKTNSSVELGVNVYFHETKGLLNCSQNDEAISEIKTRLLEISTKKRGINPQ